MPLTSLKEILQDALKGGYAVGYFEPWDQYSMEAVIQAAEKMNSPVIIGCGGMMMDKEWFDRWGMEGMAALGRVLARRSKVPTALILNEVEAFEQIVRGLVWGFNAVMLDSSHLPYEENVRLTQKVVEVAHAVGADVEAELGHLPVGSGEGSESSLTDPEQAADFVARTGVDALAVSIGNVHILLEGKSEELDFNRLAQIRQKVGVPLVIHGGTGFPDEAVRRAISLGVAKFNVGTVLKQAFLRGMAEALDETPEDASPQEVIGSRKESDIMAHARKRMRQEVERLITLYRGVTPPT
ncbi:MAG: class II fructose-bisphosphate aldolase [Anaerolineae bacterium]